jgi:spermidine synthase
MDIASNSPTRGRGLVLPTAIFCLLISGVAGLVYQVVWTRYLALFTGHTSYAIVAVLVAFMGGLALGNAWLGTLADRIRRPLAFYAWLELGIGLYALAFPHLYEYAYGFYLTVAETTPPGSPVLLAYKFLFSLLLLLLPTVMMGGTLPVLTKMLARSLNQLTGQIANLYFINSAGAVVGVALAEFWFIPIWGLNDTVVAGAAMNLLAGAVALLVSGYIREESLGPAATKTEEKDEEEPEKFSAQDIRLAIWGIAISGGVAMLYEVAWTRLLGLAMGSSSNAFAIMLITFIMGIAVGAWLIGRIRIRRNSMNWFAWLEIGVGVSIILTMFTYERLPYWFSKLANVIDRSQDNYPYFQFMRGLLSFCVMIIPTTLLGMTLPLVSRISTAEIARTGRSVGRVFSFNTIGAVMGVVITGLWALPALGLARTFALGAALNICVGILILSRNARPAQKKLVPLIIPGTVMWMILAGMLLHDNWSQYLTAGTWRSKPAAASFEDFKATENFSILYHRDGAGSTVTVKQSTNDGGIFLKVNGKADASTTTDMVTQLLLGHVPAMLHDKPEDALVIGLGSGATCGAILSHPAVQRLDAVEINSEVVESAVIFKDFNGDALNNPKMKVHVDDAKSFLQTTTNNYDIIVSEPSNPWMAGVAGLFSLEFYDACRRHLNEDGIMCQWLHIYEIPEEAINTVLKTYTLIFPYTTVWTGAMGDVILIGSLKPMDTDLDSVLDRLKQPTVAASLNQIHIARPVTFLAHQLISEEYGRFLFPPLTEQHSDHFPVLDTLAQQGQFTLEPALQLYNFDERFFVRSTMLLHRYIMKNPLTFEDLSDLANHNGYEPVMRGPMYRSLMKHWRSAYPADPTPVFLAARTKDKSLPTEMDFANMTTHLGNIGRDAKNNPARVVEFTHTAMTQMRQSRSVFYQPDAGPLIRALELFAKTDEANAHVYDTYRAELAWEQGDRKTFLEFTGRLFMNPDVRINATHYPDNDPSPRAVLARLLDYYLEESDFENANTVLGLTLNGGFAPTDATWLRVITTKAFSIFEDLRSRQEAQGRPPTAE